MVSEANNHIDMRRRHERQLDRQERCGNKTDAVLRRIAAGHERHEPFVEKVQPCPGRRSHWDCQLLQQDGSNSAPSGGKVINITVLICLSETSAKW